MMNNRLDCDIVRDMLPLYAEGLTSDASSRAISEHLAGCDDCTQALRRMTEPEQTASDPPKELDYLKKVRRRSNLKMLVSIALMLFGMSLICFRSFFVGNAANPATIVCEAAVTGSSVTVTGSLTGGDRAVSRVTFEDSAGIVTVGVYTAPKAFFNSSSFSESYEVTYPIGQVRLNDLIIWEDGTQISRATAMLFAAANPFVGDMPSSSGIAKIIGVGEQLGPYSNQLHTASEPYGWTLELENGIRPEDEKAAIGIMEADSCIMLATVGNLGYVSWRYEVAGSPCEFSLTAEQATAFAGQDIKLCSDSASQLQKLVESLGIKLAGQPAQPRD